MSSSDDNSEKEEDEVRDNMEEMLNDIFIGPHGEDFDEENTSQQKDLAKLVRLSRDAHKELYPGCKSYSKLSFVVKLLHMMSMNNWSQKSFTMLLQMFKEILPEGADIPNSFYEAKQMLRELGLTYTKIDL